MSAGGCHRPRSEGGAVSVQLTDKWPQVQASLQLGPESPLGGFSSPWELSSGRTPRKGRGQRSDRGASWVAVHTEVLRPSGKEHHRICSEESGFAQKKVPLPSRGHRSSSSRTSEPREPKGSATAPSPGASVSGPEATGLPSTGSLFTSHTLPVLPFGASSPRSSRPSGPGLLFPPADAAYQP